MTDCGVFVCRYAFSIYCIREKEFSVDRRHDREKSMQQLESMLRDVITNSREFSFGMAEITRLRQEFATLIKNLSDMYKKKGNSALSSAASAQSLSTAGPILSAGPAPEQSIVSSIICFNVEVCFVVIIFSCNKFGLITCSFNPFRIIGNV